MYINESSNSNVSTEQAVNLFCTKPGNVLRNIVSEVYNNIYAKYNGAILTWSEEECITFFMAHYKWDIKEQAWCREYGYNVLLLH